MVRRVAVCWGLWGWFLLAWAQPPLPPPDELVAADVVRIQVYQQPDLSGEWRLSEAGEIPMPLLGRVKLQGLTPTQAEQVLAEGLRSGQYLRQPQVQVWRVHSPMRQVSVLGRVQRPGRFALDGAALRLTDVMAMAGGVSPDGSEVVIISGQRQGRSFRQAVDLHVLLASALVSGSAKGADDGADPLMHPGDVVWVERAASVYVYGEVQRPGALRLERGMTVMQALAAAGGLTVRGTERGLRLHRGSGTPASQELQPQLQDRLNPHDVIYVRESLF